MKILYIAGERQAAQRAAAALRGIAPNVTLAWARNPGTVVPWVQGNRDAAAVVLEVDGQRCAAVVQQARGLGLTVPIAVVTPERPDPSAATLHTGADYVVDARSLEADLPRIVADALKRMSAAAPMTAPSSPGVRAATAGQRAARQEAEGRSAVAGHTGQQAEHRPSTEQPAAGREEATRRTELEERLAREAATRAALERDLATAESVREQAEQRLASERAEAAARLGDARAEHEAALARAARVCTKLQQRLLEVETALRSAEDRRASEAAASAAQLAQRHAEFTASLAQATRWRDTLTAKLGTATAALEEARKAREADAAAAAGHLARREAELQATLAEAVAARTAAGQTLADAEAAHQVTRQRAEADLAAAAERRAALDKQLDRESAARNALAEQLATAEAARHDADERHAMEWAAAAARLADMQARHEEAVAEHAAARAALELRLTAASAALEEAREADAATAADHLARREAALGAELAEAIADRSALEQTLAAVQAAHQEARQRTEGDLAAAAGRQAALEAQLAREAATRSALEEQLARAEAARLDADERRATELSAAANRLADVQARHEGAVAEHAAALAQAFAARTAVELTLADVEAVHREARQQAETDLAAAAGRRAALEAQLAREAETRTALEGQLARAEAARHDADERRATEQSAAASRLADVQATHEAAVAEHAAALAQAVAARTAVELTLADVEAVHREARQQAETDLAAAAGRRAALEAQLARDAATRVALEEQLARAEAARHDADRRHTTELAAATRRLADVHAQYETALSEHTAARAAFERQLADARTALDDAAEVRAVDAAAAAGHLARREAELGAAVEAAAVREEELVARIDQGSAMRAALERDLAGSRAESGASRRRLLNLVSAHRRRAREQSEQTAQLDARLERERADSERALRARDEDIGQLRLERETLEDTLRATGDQLERVQRTLDQEREVHRRARSTAESELQRASSESDQMRRSLEQVQAAFATLERVASEHATERGSLERVVAERDAQLSAEAARHVAETQAAQAALSQIQETLRETRHAGGAGIARLEREIGALRLELEGTRGEAAGLRTELEQSRKDNRRQFERAPYGLCRCTRDGVITHVNHSLVRLLGYRKADDLRNEHFAATVFECSSDLRWLIERSGTSGTESIEATWKTRDGRRLDVRLQALSTPDGSVEIAVEDITNLRAVERKLHQARRLEAVGRLASEVAVTCDALLRDVARGGEQWLDAVGSDGALRQQGELLLGEVSRAAGFLRQFAAYGSTQLSALDPVDVQRVLRDLEPVLKRIAGDDIELVLPKTSAALEVDVEAERVERVLVNVAGYARERMPHGGRVRIELSTITVGRRFLARYPNVRPGAHALITVTEERRAARQGLPPDVRDEPAAADARRPVSDRPGVDVGVLLELVGTSGGHLWMDAAPSGNMTLKIHLPKRVLDEATGSPEAAAVPADGRRPSRRFRTGQPSNVAVRAAR